MSVYLEEIGPEVMDEVDDETLDVRAVLVLVSHDHQVAVSQTLDRIVLLAKLQPLYA